MLSSSTEEAAWPSGLSSGLWYTPALGAVGWYCPCTAEGPPKRHFLQKKVCCSCFLWQGEKYEVLEQHGCSSDPCIACPSAFRYRVFLPVEVLVLSYWGICIFHNAALEWLLAGHLAGWHHVHARLTSPCFSGVILASCGWCSLPPASSQQGLMQLAAAFLNSYLAQFAASRQACSEKSLTGMGLICIQNSVGAA